MDASLPEQIRARLARVGHGALPPAEQGLFHEPSVLRRISGESVVLFGGGCALLLEVAHPMVAAGVAEHSDFRRDPWTRLQRTLAAMRTLTFAPLDEVLGAARQVAEGHRHVHGRLPEAVGRFAAGTPYTGRDPELVRWVWATLADTAVRVYRDFVAPLDDATLESYYRDHKALAVLVGVPPEIVPPDYASFRGMFDAMLEGDTLCVGRQGRAVADAVLAQAGPPGGPVGLVTAALLPERLRRDFDLAFGQTERAAYARLRASICALRTPGESGVRPGG